MRGRRYGIGQIDFRQEKFELAATHFQRAMAVRASLLHSNNSSFVPQCTAVDRLWLTKMQCTVLEVNAHDDGSTVPEIGSMQRASVRCASHHGVVCPNVQL